MEMELRDRNELPAGWERVKLKELATKITDGTHHTPMYTASGVHFISVKDINYGTIDFSKTKFISEEEHRELIKRCNPEEGDILITKSGTIGRLAIVPNREFSLFVSVALIKLNRKKIQSKYAFHALQNHVNHLDIKSQIKGGLLKNYHLEDLRLAEIVVAPFDEQQQIVSKLEELFSELDKSIEGLKTAQQQLKVYRQSVLQWAFEGKLTNEDVKEGELPEGWEWVTLNEIGKWTGGGTPSKQRKDFWENGTVLWVSPKDMKTGVIHETIDKITFESIAESSAKLIAKNSILFVVRSGIIRRTLPIAIAGGDLTTNQDLQSLTLHEGVLPQYAYWFCIANEQAIRDQCAKDGTTVDNLDVPKLKRYPVIICSLEEQARIIQEIESRFSVADKMDESIVHSLLQAEALRQSILKRAFEGKLF